MGVPKKAVPHSIYSSRKVIRITAREGSDPENRTFQEFVRVLNEKAALGVDGEWILGAMFERYKRETLAESMGLQGQFPIQAATLHQTRPLEATAQFENQARTYQEPLGSTAGGPGDRSGGGAEAIQLHSENNPIEDKSEGGTESPPATWNIM